MGNTFKNLWNQVGFILSRIQYLFKGLETCIIDNFDFGIIMIGKIDKILKISKTNLMLS